MKLPVMFYVAFTTILLVTVVIFSSLDFPYPLVFFLVVIGQFFLLLMVYRVLTDDYTTTKTFDDFYEDRPIERYDP
ncbi:MAG: hypothetical protein HKN00_10970 [Flavobacteriaceae bacterium]|nr:hypothetical protein [Bacteroidia bacterium]MBT8288780.1 hypothetical protein [Bacteroidia bacterium]NNF75700.1 hypothetical protein [Flavobacteriaceae bacterium]NNK73277.1 hypothetical protein [Flavobacteriaceae bacterium]